MKAPVENEIRNLVEFEKRFNALLQELGLKPSQRDLIRTLIAVSEGEVKFELSYSELGKHLFKCESSDAKKCRDKASYAMKSLFNWQVEHNVILIKIKRKGKRIRDKNGQLSFEKTKYEFVLLRKLVESIDKNSKCLDAAFDAVLSEAKQTFKRTKKKKLYHPNHLIKKAKSTVKTKLIRIFALAVNAEKNPLDECIKVLREAEESVRSLEKKRIQDVKRKDFVKQFEAELTH